MISAALTVAVSCVALPGAAIGVPFQLIVQAVPKPVPVAVKTKGEDVGAIGVRVTGATPKGNGAVVTPAHVTVTGMFFPMPAAVICAAVTVAVSNVALPVAAIGVPFQLIVQPATKFVPVACSETGPDAADAGARLARVAVAADDAGGVATDAATDGVVGAPWDGAGAFIRIDMP